MFIPALVCFISSLIAAVAAVLHHNGFGLYDIYSFTIFTLPFAFLIGIFASRIKSFISSRKLIIRIIFSVCAGFLCAFAWTILVASFLGPWMGAFSFPVLFCWVAGGFSGILSVGVFLEQSKPKRVTFAVVGLSILSVVFILIVRVSQDYVRVLKSVHVIILKWEHTPEPLNIQNTSTFTENGPRMVLSEEEIRLIRQTGITGTLGIHGGIGLSKSPNTIILILRAPVYNEVMISVPQRTTAVFLQQEDRFIVYPKKVRVFKDRKIRIGPVNKTDPSNVFLWDGPQGYSIMTFPSY